MSLPLHIVDLGRMDYAEALNIQEKLHAAVLAGTHPDTLLLVEHPPVLTLGRRGEREHILADDATLATAGASIYEVSRGGDVTYHGPGQIVGYPIFNLEKHGRDIHQFVNRIEDSIITLCQRHFSIEAGRDTGTYTGVWVGNHKICAIGIHVKRWVTLHGFAFNVNTELSHFNWIVPCGLHDRGVTSVASLTGNPVDFRQANLLTGTVFAEIFSMEPQWQHLGEWRNTL